MSLPYVAIPAGHGCACLDAHRSVGRGGRRRRRRVKKKKSAKSALNAWLGVQEQQPPEEEMTAAQRMRRGILRVGARARAARAARGEAPLKLPSRPASESDDDDDEQGSGTGEMAPADGKASATDTQKDPTGDRDGAGGATAADLLDRVDEQTAQPADNSDASPARFGPDAHPAALAGVKKVKRAVKKMSMVTQPKVRVKRRRRKRVMGRGTPSASRTSLGSGRSSVASDSGTGRGRGRTRTIRRRGESVTSADSGSANSTPRASAGRGRGRLRLAARGVGRGGRLRNAVRKVQMARAFVPRGRISTRSRRTSVTSAGSRKSASLRTPPKRKLAGSRSPSKLPAPPRSVPRGSVPRHSRVVSGRLQGLLETRSRQDFVSDGSDSSSSDGSMPSDFSLDSAAEQAFLARQKRELEERSALMISSIKTFSELRARLEALSVRAKVVEVHDRVTLAQIEVAEQVLSKASALHAYCSSAPDDLEAAGRLKRAVQVTLRVVNSAIANVDAAVAKETEARLGMSDKLAAAATELRNASDKLAAARGRATALKPLQDSDDAARALRAAAATIESAYDAQRKLISVNTAGGGSRGSIVSAGEQFLKCVTEVGRQLKAVEEVVSHREFVTKTSALMEEPSLMEERVKDIKSVVAGMVRNNEDAGEPADEATTTLRAAVEALDAAEAHIAAAATLPTAVEQQRRFKVMSTLDKEVSRANLALSERNSSLDRVRAEDPAATIQDGITTLLVAAAKLAQTEARTAHIAEAEAKAQAAEREEDPLLDDDQASSGTDDDDTDDEVKQARATKRAVRKHRNAMLEELKKGAEDGHAALSAAQTVQALVVGPPESMSLKPKFLELALAADFDVQRLTALLRQLDNPELTEKITTAHRQLEGARTDLNNLVTRAAGTTSQVIVMSRKPRLLEQIQEASELAEQLSGGAGMDPAFVERFTKTVNRVCTDLVELEAEAAAYQSKAAAEGRFAAASRRLQELQLRNAEAGSPDDEGTALLGVAASAHSAADTLSGVLNAAYNSPEVMSQFAQAVNKLIAQLDSAQTAMNARDHNNASTFLDEFQKAEKRLRRCRVELSKLRKSFRMSGARLDSVASKLEVASTAIASAETIRRIVKNSADFRAAFKELMQVSDLADNDTVHVGGRLRQFDTQISSDGEDNGMSGGFLPFTPRDRGPSSPRACSGSSPPETPRGLGRSAAARAVSRGAQRGAAQAPGSPRPQTGHGGSRARHAAMPSAETQKLVRKFIAAVPAAEAAVENLAAALTVVGVTRHQQTDLETVNDAFLLMDRVVTDLDMLRAAQESVPESSQNHRGLESAIAEALQTVNSASTLRGLVEHAPASTDLAQEFVAAVPRARAAVEAVRSLQNELYSELAAENVAQVQLAAARARVQALKRQYAHLDDETLDDDVSAAIDRANQTVASLVQMQERVFEPDGSVRRGASRASARSGLTGVSDDSTSGIRLLPYDSSVSGARAVEIEEHLSAIESREDDATRRLESLHDDVKTVAEQAKEVRAFTADQRTREAAARDKLEDVELSRAAALRELEEALKESGASKSEVRAALEAVTDTTPGAGLAIAAADSSELSRLKALLRSQAQEYEETLRKERDAYAVASDRAVEVAQREKALAAAASEEERQQRDRELKDMREREAQARVDADRWARRHAEALRTLEASLLSESATDGLPPADAAATTALLTVVQSQTAALEGARHAERDARRATATAAISRARIDQKLAAAVDAAERRELQAELDDAVTKEKRSNDALEITSIDVQAQATQFEALLEGEGEVKADDDSLKFVPEQSVAQVSRLRAMLRQRDAELARVKLSHLAAKVALEDSLRRQRDVDAQLEQTREREENLREELRKIQHERSAALAELAAANRSRHGRRNVRRSSGFRTSRKQSISDQFIEAVQALEHELSTVSTAVGELSQTQRLRQAAKQSRLDATVSILEHAQRLAELRYRFEMQRRVDMRSGYESGSLEAVMKAKGRLAVAADAVQKGRVKQVALEIAEGSPDVSEVQLETLKDELLAQTVVAGEAVDIAEEKVLESLRVRATDPSIVKAREEHLARREAACARRLQDAHAQLDRALQTAVDDLLLFKPGSPAAAAVQTAAELAEEALRIADEGGNKLKSRSEQATAGAIKQAAMSMASRFRTMALQFDDTAMSDPMASTMGVAVKRQFDAFALSVARAVRRVDLVLSTVEHLRSRRSELADTAALPAAMRKRLKQSGGRRDPLYPLVDDCVLPSAPTAPLLELSGGSASLPSVILDTPTPSIRTRRKTARMSLCTWAQIPATFMRAVRSSLFGGRIAPDMHSLAVATANVELDLDRHTVLLKTTSFHYRALITKLRTADMQSLPLEPGVPLKQALRKATGALRSADKALPLPCDRVRRPTRPAVAIALDRRIRRAAVAVVIFERALRRAEIAVAAIDAIVPSPVKALAREPSVIDGFGSLGGSNRKHGASSHSVLESLDDMDDDGLRGLRRRRTAADAHDRRRDRRRRHRSHHHRSRHRHEESESEVDDGDAAKPTVEVVNGTEAAPDKHLTRDMSAPLPAMRPMFSGIWGPRPMAPGTALMTPPLGSSGSPLRPGAKTEQLSRSPRREETERQRFERLRRQEIEARKLVEDRLRFRQHGGAPSAAKSATISPRDDPLPPTLTGDAPSPPKRQSGAPVWPGGLMPPGAALFGPRGPMPGMIGVPPPGMMPFPMQSGPGGARGPMPMMRARGPPANGLGPGPAMGFGAPGMMPGMRPMPMPVGMGMPRGAVQPRPPPRRYESSHSHATRNVGASPIRASPRRSRLRGGIPSTL